MATEFIDEDFVRVWREQGNKSAGRVVTLVFGDEIEVLQALPGWTEVRVANYYDGTATGFIEGTPALRSDGILKMSMVDIQQGDGLIIETPTGKIVFVDGGDNKLFARHAAARFRHRHSSRDDPLEIDAIIVTHGDADHYAGLTQVKKSERLPNKQAHKRLFIKPRRVFSNGIVKAPTAVPEQDRLGAVAEKNGARYLVDLYDDPRTAPPEALNRDFTEWKKTLDHWGTRGPIIFKRIYHGMSGRPFKFLEDEGVAVEIQGPFTDRITHDGASVEALPLLHAPKRSPELALEGSDPNAGAESASHTINGHSVALRLTYGNVRFSLTGDLNQAGMQRMFSRLAPAELEAEVLKAPHHGSHEFDFAALRAAKPVVALVSSGDEDSFHEYIHPRATLMAALGQAMPGQAGVVFGTELAAFFHTRDYASKRSDLRDFFAGHEKRRWDKAELVKLFAGQVDKGDPKAFFAFERTNFGIIHVRTDGERLLVFTHSGKAGVNEAYRLRVRKDSAGERQATFEETVTR